MFNQLASSLLGLFAEEKIHLSTPLGVTMFTTSIAHKFGHTFLLLKSDLDVQQTDLRCLSQFTNLIKNLHNIGSTGNLPY